MECTVPLLNVGKRNTMKNCRKRGAFKIKSHQGYLCSLKLFLYSALLKKLLILLWPHYPLLINNLIILNFILIGMFAFFLAGYMLPEFFLGKKKKKTFYGSTFSVTVGVKNSSDFSIFTNVNTVLSWKIPTCLSSNRNQEQIWEHDFSLACC